MVACRPRLHRPSQASALHAQMLADVSPREFALITCAFGLSGMGTGRLAAEIFLQGSHRGALGYVLSIFGAFAGALLFPAAMVPAGTCCVLAVSIFLVEHHLAPCLEANLSARDAADLLVILHAGGPLLLGGFCLWRATAGM